MALRLALSIAILIISFQFAAGQAQDIPAFGVEAVYLAKDDGTGKAGPPATEFRTTDIPIYCVVQLESKRKSVVKMVFVARNVGGVRPDTKVVTSTYTTTSNQDRVNFTGRPDRVWVPGNYRVDVFVDDKLAAGVDFVIRSDAVTVIAKPLRTTTAKRSKPRSGPSVP